MSELLVQVTISNAREEEKASQTARYEELKLEELNLPGLINDFNAIYSRLTQIADESQQRINDFTKTDPYSIELKSYEEPTRTISQSAKEAYLKQKEAEIDTILSLLNDETSSPKTIDTAINRLQTIDASIPTPFKQLCPSVESTISTSLTITVAALSICTIHYLNNPNFDLDTFKVLLMTSVVSICLVYNKHLLHQLNHMLEVVKNIPLKDPRNIQISRHTYGTHTQPDTATVQAFTDATIQYKTAQQEIAADFNNRLCQTHIDNATPITTNEQEQLQRLEKEAQAATS